MIETKTNSKDGMIVGYDPGGKNNHGVAFLKINNGTPVDIRIMTHVNSESVISEISTLIKSENIIGLGVDTLSCWGTGDGGWRPADKWLRRRYPEVRNSVMVPNALYGAMVINGMSVLIEVANIPSSTRLVLSETHPKVLYYALTQNRYDYVNNRNNMDSFLSEELGVTIQTSSDHQWDAVISAYALFMGVTGNWGLDLHTLPLATNERVVKPCGETFYYWLGEIL